MDPASVSSAVGAANALAKNSLVRDLLGPVAKAYGADWGERAQERLEKAKVERRAKNLEEHIAKAEQDIPIDRVDPTILEAWAIAVSEVDPADEELSDAWRAALRAAATSNPYREKILRVLQNMTSDEVHHFIAKGRPFGFPTEYRRRFVELGLCHPAGERVISTIIWFLPIALLLACCAYFFIPRGLDFREIVRSGDRTTTFFVVTYLTLASVLAGVASYISLIRRPALTRLGAALWRLSHSRIEYKVTVASTGSGNLAGASKKARRTTKS